MHYSGGAGGPDGAAAAAAAARLHGDPMGSDFTALHLRVQLIFFLLFHRRKLERLKSSEHEIPNRLEPADV